jgi:outer membrane protein with beta-barrel domain
MKRTLNLLVLLALVFSAPALASTIDKGNGEIGFNYGQTQLDSDTGFESSATSMAVRGGYFFNPKVELEGQLSNSTDSQDVSGTNVDGTFRMYMVNGVYNFQTPKEIVPYVLAGLGVMDNEVKATGLGSVSDSSTAYQIGAGSRFFFGKAKKAAFRVDLSMIQESTFDQTNTHTNMSAGFSWKLGGR